MAKLTVLLVLLTLFLSCACVYSLRCRFNQFTVENVLGNLSCIDCPACMPGYGLSPQCGNYVKYGTKIECKPCKLGMTYSATHNIESCRPCGICSDHQKVIRNCTLESNSKCNHSCSKGFYYEEVTGDCKACSFCCSDGRNTVKDDCKDMPFYKQCDANEIMINCQPKCQDDQYLVVTKKGAVPYCKNCKNCPPGSSLSPHCGSIVENINDIKCVECIEGKTFLEKPGNQPCRPCSSCSVGQKELRPCNLTHDRVCGRCEKGFYNATGNECKPCSACCNDENDVRIPECVKQNMPRNKQCILTQRAINVCQQNNAQHGGSIIQAKSPGLIIAMSIIAIGCFTALTVMVFWKYLKYRKYKGLPRSQSLAELLPSSLEEPQTESHSTTLEVAIAHGSQESLAFEKSGVLVQFSDGQSFFNDAQGVRLEICWVNNFVKTLQPGEVQLSPIIKFHPYELQLSKPAQVKIPHSALVFYSNGWDVKLKSSTLHGEKIVWKNEEQYEVHNNEVSFHADYLLSYVVVGASLCNDKPTKKRLQCAVFGGEGRVGANYTAYLYIFDDCEASLEKIMQEERSHNRILLGSPQSLYVESVTETDIKISVKQPVDGWIVGEIKPEVITHKSVKESYQTIPRTEILFKHDNGRNRDFLCIFEVSAGNTTTTICAVTSIKEDPFRRFQECNPGFSNDKHRLVTGRNLCDPLITDQERSSPCLHDLPEEVLHAVCMKLDMPLKGVGNWRHVAADLGFPEEQIQVFRNEMLTPDGSPCTVMLYALKTRSPNLTVVEFVQILQTRKIKRFDVVDVLEPYVYDPI
ncbi:uncharacterized protein LOC144653833 [Oculina patagonica]